MHEADGSGPRRRRFVVLALVLLGLLALDYVLSVATVLGRRLDRRAIVDPGTGHVWAFDRPATSELGHAVAAASFTLFALALLVLALRGKGPRFVVSAAVMVAGAALTAQALKPALGAVDLLGGVGDRWLGASFPSGHSTIAMSLGLALVWAVPAAWAPTAAILAVAYSIAVGVGLLLLGWHHPSDVVAGYFVAGAWTAAMAASFEPGPSVAARAGSPWRRLEGRRVGPLTLARAIAALALLSGLALPLIGMSYDAPERPLPPGFAEGATAIALCAAIVAVATARLRLHCRRRRAVPQAAARP